MQVAEKQRHRIAPIDDIPEGGGVLADVGGEREIGIFKHDGRLYAYENRCIHAGGPVCSGNIIGRTRQVLDDIGRVLAEVDSEDEPRLICPWHGWEYDLKTGEVCHDRRYRLRRYELLVEDGVVYVEA